MKPAAIGAISLLVIGASSWFMLNREPVITTHSTDVTTSVPGATSTTISTTISTTAAELVGEGAAQGGETSVVVQLRQRIDVLTLARQELVAERSSAEAFMQQAEREIASLERFIEEIEERGEDPVDYADEGLAMFRPASEAYQDASEKLELAKEMEQAAAVELSAAETKLANILFESDSEQ